MLCIRNLQNNISAGNNNHKNNSKTNKPIKNAGKKII
jgi:hypothetical protein